MEALGILGAGFFMLVVAVSFATEFYDLHRARRDKEEGRDDYFLLPRRRYQQLHQESYPLLPTSTSPGLFMVRREQRAARCEICHQADCFDGGSGFCRRCNHTTA
jgi:hypothetical protein